MHIHGLVVSSKYQCLGIGTKLIHAAENLARELGLKKITLEVLESNQRAYMLYKRLGFSVLKQVEFSKKHQLYFNSRRHIYMLKKL